MYLIRGAVPCARRLAGLGPTLSREARQRLRWMDHYRTQGQNAARTCRYFGISWQTFYRAKRRYDPADLTSLEPAPTAPGAGASRPRPPPWPTPCASSGTGTPFGGRASSPSCSGPKGIGSPPPWSAGSSPR